jgi:anti-sigma factor RsiW
MPDDNMIVEISCFEVWRRLSDYVDDDIEPDLKARLAYHFARCRDCKALLDGTRNVVALIGDEHTFELPSGASERISSALERRIAEDRKADG